MPNGLRNYYIATNLINFYLGLLEKLSRLTFTQQITSSSVWTSEKKLNGIFQLLLFYR